MEHKKTKKTKCHHCNKKPRPINILVDCKCNGRFCLKHISPETHQCSFDYIKEGKEILERRLPLIDNDKVNNRI